MVKLMYVITPKPGMSRDEFRRYWLEIHAPIVREIPHLERYVINVFRPRSGTAAPAIGGVAEQWFASADAMRAAFGTVAAERARADIANFAEVTQIVSGLVDEHIVVEPQQS
jgi:uncharacterized protein (TIGR02118 family)